MKNKELIKTIKKNFEEWQDNNCIVDMIREKDTVFHNILEVNEKTGEVSVGLYDGGNYTEGWTQIFSFSNARDLANMDTSGYCGIVFSKDSVIEAKIGKDSIEFLDYGCIDEAWNFLLDLVKNKMITDEEKDTIWKEKETPFVIDFLVDDETEALENALEEHLQELAKKEDEV